MPFLFFVRPHQVVQSNIMISCNNYLVFEGEKLEILNEIEEMLFSSIPGKISSMNEDVSLDLIGDEMLQLVN